MAQRFRGNLDLLSLLQDDYDRKQSGSIREEGLQLREQGLQQRGQAEEASIAIRQQQEALQEQMEGLREEHQAQVLDIQQQAAAAHDEMIGAQLAKSQAEQKLMQDQASDVRGFFTDVQKLNPQDPGYLASRAALLAKYPHADAKTDDGTESAVSGHLKALDAANERWSTNTTKLASGPSPEIRSAYASAIGKVAAAQAAYNDEIDPDKKEINKQNLAAFQAGQTAYENQFPGIQNPVATPTQTPTVTTPPDPNRPPLDQFLPPPK